MAQNSESTKVQSTPSGLPQTIPIEPSRRVPRSDVSICKATVDDLPTIVRAFETAIFLN